MDKDAQIEALLKEADNARSWFVKYVDELINDPTNESLLRLKDLCRAEFEKRWDKLADLGIFSNPNIKRPRIDE